jgi:hypothetical protein
VKIDSAVMGYHQKKQNNITYTFVFCFLKGGVIKLKQYEPDDMTTSTHQTYTWSEDEDEHFLFTGFSKPCTAIAPPHHPGIIQLYVIL